MDPIASLQRGQDGVVFATDVSPPFAFDIKCAACHDPSHDSMVEHPGHFPSRLSPYALCQHCPRSRSVNRRRPVVMVGEGVSPSINRTLSSTGRVARNNASLANVSISSGVKPGHNWASLPANPLAKSHVTDTDCCREPVFTCTASSTRISFCPGCGFMNAMST